MGLSLIERIEPNRCQNYTREGSADKRAASACSSNGTRPFPSTPGAVRVRSFYHLAVLTHQSECRALSPKLTFLTMSAVPALSMSRS
jgi:hypothetical protein